MTLAYSSNALIYDAELDGYALRADFDPALHQVDISFGQAAFWQSGSKADWNDPDDPPISHVRDLSGIPVHAGHAYVVDRLQVIGPNSKCIRVDVIEIDHDPVGFMATDEIQPGITYRLAEAKDLYRTKAQPQVATGFGPGTMVATRQGEIPVEWLVTGDQVLTFDGSVKSLLWVGHAKFSAREVARDPLLRPLCLRANMHGAITPTHDLCVASEAQILLSGAEISLHFGMEHALAPAEDMGEYPQANHWAHGVTYFALLFDQHQVVMANGIWCSSLFADPEKSDLLARQFPTMPTGIQHSQFALPCLKDWEVGVIREDQSNSEPQRLVAAA